MNRTGLALLGCALALLFTACGGGGDTTKPAVSLQSSSTNVTAAGAITLTATASDNVGVTRVEFFDGASKVGEDTSAPYTQNLSLSAADNGTKSYTAKASDAVGNSQTSTAVQVSVNIAGAASCPNPAVFDNPACTFDSAGAVFGN